MDISITRWVSNGNVGGLSKNIVDSKRFSLSVTTFRHGYRRVGVSLHKSVLGGYFFSINFWTGQIFGDIS